MPAIMAQARIVHDLLPSLINFSCSPAWPESADGGVECFLRDCGHIGILIRYSADADDASEWRVISRYASRKLEKHGFTCPEPSISPGRVLFAEPRLRPDEGSKARRLSSGPNHRRTAFSRDIRLFCPVANRGYGRMRGRLTYRCRLAEKLLLGGAFHQPQLVDHARDVNPPCCCRLFERARQAVAQTRGPALEANPAVRKLQIAQDPACFVCRRLRVRVAAEQCRRDLLFDRYAFHCAGHKNWTSGQGDD